MWNDIRVFTSSNENVWKYVFTKKDSVAESVLYRYPSFDERTVICCSTMSGCQVGCRFCGSGDFFIKNFSAEEIVSQPVKLLNDVQIKFGVHPSDIKRLQIMFMSMGEPLLNLKNLIPALHKLYGLYPQAALLISTIGPRINYEPLMQVSEEIPTIGLQFSIHESTDENRDKLIPFKGKLSLKEIAETGYEWFLRTGRTPFFNYCAHENNSSIEDADRLRELFDPSVWQATISVICEREEHVAASNERQKNLALDFDSKLLERGFSTRVFDPAGQDDIGGGCGQLWFVQDWAKKNQDLVKPSVGHSLPVIHTPRSCCGKE